MTGVVLRCPHCGTTRSTPGECEACHEAQVRYFCTSHNPGEWLDEPTCPRCGAKFGERPAPPAPPPRRSRSARPPPLRTRDASPTPTAARPPRAERPPATERPSPWGRRPRSPDSSAGGSDLGDPRVWRRLPDFRRPFPGAGRFPPGPGESPDSRLVVGPTPGGCLRFLLVAALLFLLAMFSLSLLIGDMAMRVLML